VQGFANWCETAPKRCIFASFRLNRPRKTGISQGTSIANFGAWRTLPMVEVITVEKAELIRLIDASVEGAIEKAINSSKAPDIMTKAEVAKYLKKSGATINRWMRHHGLPYHGVGRPTFNRAEVDKWLAQI
jgi:excisionase family DNA binding protein